MPKSLYKITADRFTSSHLKYTHFFQEFYIRTLLLTHLLSYFTDPGQKITALRVKNLSRSSFIDHAFKSSESIKHNILLGKAGNAKYFWPDTVNNFLFLVWQVKASLSK